jgi:hypothetical protein
MHALERNLRNFYFVIPIVMVGLLSTDASAESFVAPAAGTLYVKCVGGSAGAVSQFGTGTSVANFVPLIGSLPQTCPSPEVPIGPVSAGQTIPFGIHTVWEGADHWAFSAGADEASMVAFSDVYDTLKMDGKIIQRTGANTWVLHLSDAAHHTVSLDLADNILIQLRLVVNESQPPPLARASDSRAETIDGSWSGTFSDTKASGSLDLDLTQGPEGQIVGTYTSSLGGGGQMKGQLTEIELRFEMTQTVAGCPGTYTGKGTRIGDHIAGTYTGNDCLGNHGNGTFTMARAGSREAATLAPSAPTPVRDAEPQAPTRPGDGELAVTAIGYRVIPHFRTMSYQVPGRSNTTCYGSGTYFGNTVSATADCSTVTTPPQERQTTVGYTEIYNQVEANGMVYTLRCTRGWIGSNCSSLIPGDMFGAKVKDATMLITARRGGNMGKEIHSKYQLLDVRPRSQANP